MKTNSHALLAVALVAGLALTGCYTPDGRPDRTASGALGGAAVGATSGALIGRSPGAAIIGGAIGAIGGSLIGNAMDANERARLQAQAPQTYERLDQGQPLQVADVRAMAAAGIKDDLIISQIRSTRTTYRLSASEIIELRDAGVSDRVIEFMINTGGSSTGSATAVPQVQTGYVAQPPPPPPMETVYVAPGPGYVWVGGEWAWHGRWVWTGGRWVYPPRHGAVWVRTTWSHGPRGYYRHHGHWR